MMRFRKILRQAKSDYIYKYRSKKRFGGIRNVETEIGKELIAEYIRMGEPFALARIGFGEIDFLYECIKKYEHNLPLRGFKHAGLEDVLSYDESQIESYMKLLSNSYGDIDLFACWYRNTQEGWLMKRLATKTAVGMNESVLEAFWDGDKAWTKELKGKKVLVVTAFAKTVEQQYKKRSEIFPNGFLPEFELKTLQSVWYDNDAGKDERFSTWYDALEYMQAGVDRIDYDIALLGCGAFGTPLLAHMKRNGKQAIYVGGALQLMFGIRGRRWDDPSYAIYHPLFNEYWVYPGDDNKPTNRDALEDGCYW